MIIKERLYVSVASWKKRIDNVKVVLGYMLKQTLQPYKIIVNLCTEDFPNCEEDLPSDLLELIDKHSDLIEIYWYIENYKAWKKHIHMLDFVNDDDLIVCIDDDWEYSERFLEAMYLSYCYYGKKYPICNNKNELTLNFWPFYGPGTLYWKECFPKNYKKYLTQEILHCKQEDLIILILLAMNNVVVMPNKFYLPEANNFNNNDPLTVGVDNETLRGIIKEREIALDNMLNEKYFNFNDPGFYPLFWKILKNCHDYCKTINNPFPELTFINEMFEENYLCCKSEFIRGNWISEKLHLNIDL